jgi:hypothetical protein
MNETNKGNKMERKRLETKLANLEIERLNVLGGFNEDKGHRLSENQCNKLEEIHSKKLELRKQIKKTNRNGEK